MVLILNGKRNFKNKHMNILSFKPGSKFILTEDFTVTRSNYRGEQTVKVYPKQLVLSVRNLRFKSNGELSIRFVIVRAKPIIKLYYEDIESESYQQKVPWNNYISSIAFTLCNEDLERFFNEGNFIEFTKDYNDITHYDPKKSVS